MKNTNEMIGTDNSTIGDSLSMEYKATLDNIGSVEMSSDVVQDILNKVFSVIETVLEISLSWKL